MSENLSQVSSSLTPLHLVHQRSKQNPKQPVHVLLLSIHRFLVDKHYLFVVDQCQTAVAVRKEDESDGESSTAHQTFEAYDLLVTDGTSVGKWTLAASLNTLVQKCVLFDGCVINVTDYKIVFDEKIEGGGDGIVYVTEVNASEQVVDQGTLGQVELLFSDRMKELSESPLTGSRGYYSPLWDDDNFEIQSEALELHDSGIMAKRKTLAQILETEDQKATVIGRVHKKTKLNHFGKVTDNQEYPFFFNILLVDESLEHGVPVSIWNRLAVKYYHDVQVGDVIQITSYRIKKCYNATVFTSSQDQPAFTREISVNSGKRSNIYKLNNVRAEFAPINIELVNTRDLHFLPDLAVVNVAGLIVHLSKLQRELIQSPDSIKYPEPKYTQFIYLTIIDAQSLKKIHCKVYSNSRKGQLERLSVGSLVLLTDMTVYSVCPNSIISQRQFLLQSSYVTNVIPEDDIGALFPLIKSDRTKISINSLNHQFDEDNEDVLRYIQRERLETATIPHLRIDNIHLYKELFPRHEQCFFKELFQIGEDLQYQETRTVIVQAHALDLIDPQARKRKRSLTNHPRKRRGEGTVIEEEEEEEQYESMPFNERDDIVLNVTLEDMNRTNSLETTLHFWRLEDYHPLLTRDSVSVAQQAKRMFHFFHQNIADVREDLTFSDCVLALSETIRNKLFICCIQAYRSSATHVQYSLTQAFPVPNKR